MQRKGRSTPPLLKNNLFGMGRLLQTRACLFAITLITKTTYLIVENLAQTNFRFSPFPLHTFHVGVVS